jgi:hypothetical protein
MKIFPKEDIEALKAMQEKLKDKIAEDRRIEASHKHNPFYIPHGMFVTTDPGFEKKKLSPGGGTGIHATLKTSRETVSVQLAPWAPS